MLIGCFGFESLHGLMPILIAVKPAPERYKKIIERVRLNSERTPYHMSPIVELPVLVEDTILTLEPMSLAGAGIGGEKEELRGSNLRPLTKL